MSTASHAEPDRRYSALITALAPILAAHALWQAVQARDTRLLREKLSIGLPRRDDRPLWLHCSSVGEVNAARPLVDALRRHHADIPIVVTTFTSTGADTAARVLGPGVSHVYLPLDLRGPARRFLQRLRPRCAVVMETEIWPRLYHQCRAAGVPLLIVNGRLSERTLDRPPWMRLVLARALANVDRILARSESDARGFAALGAPPERIAVIGNLKFAQTEAAGATPAAIRLPRPYVVAASTHEDEELQVARAWLTMEVCASHLLVIVPRHPRRKPAIVQQLRGLGAPLAVRSDGDTVTAGTRLYLADTFGELTGFIAGAELVFVGGSLVPRGGQNVIEVARLGKVALFGPHMEHFADERALLLEHGAAIEVTDVADLMKWFSILLGDSGLNRETGERARSAVASRKDVAERYLEAITPYIQGVR